MIVDVSKYIRQVTDEPGYEDGFYFVDETEDINGPYLSAETADMNLQIYKDQLK